MNPEVDIYLKKTKQWRAEMSRLRMILLDYGLDEEMKWHTPCYTLKGGNIAIVQGFRNYCALLFFKGVLLRDPDNVLVKSGENTNAGRQIRFTGVGDINAIEPAIRACIRNAIEVDKEGLKVNSINPGDLKIPRELQRELDASPEFNSAFNALTPGRQKAYIFFFSASKKAETRERRIEKYKRNILEGKGINERK